MSLETPDRVAASAVLLFQKIDDPGNETVEFLSNNGFASVSLVFNEEDPPEVVGALLRMDQPVNNLEGAVAVGGDLAVDPADTGGYISPNHFQTGDPWVDDIEPFQCVVVVSPFEPVFRLTVTVLAMTAIPLNEETQAAIADEPVAP